MIMSGGDPVRCATCQKGLKDAASIVGERFYHPDCLKCAMCNKKVEQSCYDADGKTMCKECYTTKFVPKCSACQKPIESGKILKLFDKEYHEKCQPVCLRCKKAPPDRTYVKSADKKPFCFECFWMNARDERRKQTPTSAK